MTVLDIGAHHGFYSLLASRVVGEGGKVFSFEPSPRERRRLLRHVRINSCSNIWVQSLAVGAENNEADLYVVEVSASGCNSLRPPSVDANSNRIPVHVVRLDKWATSHKVNRVDFIKLDVEGAELAALEGAPKLLSRLRPVILAEVQDVRTAPWGYRAREIVTLLERLEYSWFQPAERGVLREFNTSIEDFDVNLVAVPREQVQSVLDRVNAPDAKSKD
jgi:FkbM family methyltransferase